MEDGQKEYEFTRKMHCIMEDCNARLKSFYCREDFEEAMKRYHSAPDDGKPSRRRDLQRMCTARGIDTEKLMQTSAVPRFIPRRSELQEELLELFHNLCREAPSSADYMCRLVQELAPEYRSDSVRVAILKKFVLGAGFTCETYDTAAIIDWAVSRMSPSQRALYQSASKEAKLHMIVNNLDDTIFSKVQLPVKLSAQEILSQINKQAIKNKKIIILTNDGEKCQEPVFSVNHLREETRKEYRSFCKAANISPSNSSDLSDFLKPMIDSLDETAPAAERSLQKFVSLLEKDYIPYLKEHFYLSRTGVLSPIYTLYEENIKKKKKSSKCALLPLCTELAEGTFKTNNGQTRVNLYHFAIMFGMTLREKSGNGDDLRDIQKNLFEDYYCDNLIRFLSDDSKDRSITCGWEKEPCGDGINFKNFAEVIYLYYLCIEDPALTPGMRIDRAEEKIRACLKAPHKAACALPRQNLHTQFFFDMFFDVIRKAEEDQLVSVICDNFVTDGAGKTKTQYASDMITAYDVALDMLHDLEMNQMDTAAALVFENPTNGYIQDAKEAANFMFEWSLAPLLKEKYPEDEPFLRLVDQIDQRLTTEFNWISIRKKDITAHILHKLYHHSSAGYPIGMETLRPLLQKVDITVTGSMISQCIDILSSIGFDIHQYSGLEESILSWDISALECDKCKQAAKSSGRNNLKEILQPLLSAYAEQTSAINLRDIVQEKDTAAALTDIVRLKALGMPIETDISYGILISWKRNETNNCFSDVAIEEYCALMPDSRKKQTFRLLHEMKDAAEHTCTIRLKNISQQISRKAKKISLQQIVNATAEITKSGTALRWNGTDESLFVLACREYNDPACSEIITHIRNIHYFRPDPVRTLLTNLIYERLHFERKLTRTALLAICTSNYVSLIPDTDSIDSFQDLYEDFLSTVNTSLIESRFQPLHEKNVLDMYIILSLYFYLAENGKE